MSSSDRRRSAARSPPREYHPIARAYNVSTVKSHDIIESNLRVPKFIRVFPPYFCRAIQQSNRDDHQIAFRHPIAIIREKESQPPTRTLQQDMIWICAPDSTP